MKKLAITCCAVFAFFAASAQGLGLGVKGGLNIANQDISGQGISLDTKARTSFHGGVFVTFMFSDKLGIQPELLYSMQGSTAEFGQVKYEERLDYLSVPILLRYNINEMFSLHAGPQLGFLLAAEEEYDGNTSDIKEDFKGTDFGLAIGAEVDLPMKLGVGVRYVAGLSDIVEPDGSWGTAEIKNSIFQIYVKFRLFGN